MDTNKMKFIVEFGSKFSGRLGCFVQTENVSNKKFQTPLLIQTTKSGSIPYLSREVFKYITDEPQILEICLATTLHMEEALKVFQKGVLSFVGYPEFLTFLTVKDPCEVIPSGFNDRNIVPVFTKRGKVEITADRFMDLVETFEPNFYHSLYDSDTNIDSGKKRILKSIDRTEKFVKTCLERHKNSEKLKNSFLFAPIVGGFNKESRTKFIKTISSISEIDGYLIDGLHNNGKTATNLKLDSLKDIVSHCLKELNCDMKPKMLFGAYNPLAILEMIRIGIDIFDSSYIFLATTNNRALIFNSDIEKDEKSSNLFIDLSNESFKEDFSPFLDDCTCLACKKHTRAYVHHLIKTKELLGPILLMIHNTKHYLQFFDNIRKTIAKDKLPELIEFIEQQQSVLDEIDETEATSNKEDLKSTISKSNLDESNNSVVDIKA